MAGLDGGGVGQHQSESTSTTTDITVAPNLQGSGSANTQVATGGSNIAPQSGSGVNLQGNTLGNSNKLTINNTSSDYGAIGAALQFGNNALQTASGALQSALGQSNQVIASTPVGDAATITKIVTILAVSVGVVVLFVMVGKKG